MLVSGLPVKPQDLRAVAGVGERLLLGSVGLVLAESNPALGGIIYIGTVALGATVGIVIAVPFLAAVVALLYVDRRIRLEGLDVALGQALEQGPEDRPA